MSEVTPPEGFRPICTVEEVPEHMPFRGEVDGRGVLVCRDGGQFYAVDEICPHENKSMRRGVVFRGEIVCPHHQYRFELETGRCHRRCAPLQTYELTVFDGEVWIGAPQ